MGKTNCYEIVETNLHDTFLFHFYTKEFTYNT